MTPEGEKWARQAINDARTGMQTRGVSNSLLDQSEFWLRAFAAEVEKRAKVPRQWSNLEPMSEGERVFVSFREVTRELLGGDHV